MAPTSARWALSSAPFRRPPPPLGSAYVTANADTTLPWGFVDSSCPLSESEAAWQEALRLGPTDPAALERAVAAAQSTSGAEGRGLVEGAEGYYDPN